MEWFDAADNLITVLGTLGGIWLGHMFGERKARGDRLRDVERRALDDTWDWLADILDLMTWAAQGRWWTVSTEGRRISRRRYPRQLPELIADDDLIEALATTLPMAIEALPRVPHDLSTQLAALRFMANRAMLDQERELERTGKFKQASARQQERLLESAERIQRATAKWRGWGRVKFVAGTLLP